MDANENYVASGALVDNDVVVTVAHKVKAFTKRPGDLKVRLGDWDPNGRNRKEDFDFTEREVDCVTLHPKQDLSNTLANNVAVLKLKKRPRLLEAVKVKTVSGVIELKSAVPERPGNRPEGVAGSSIIDTRSSKIDLRLGLVATEKGLTGLGERIGDNKTTEILLNYYNTICLPTSSSQFSNYNGRCWVASWGDRQERQREIDLPLLSR